MSSTKDLCIKYFGTDDLYEVLSVARSASKKQIKKAYHKLSLRVHPDRVSENEKQAATEKFKVLGRVHSILQDEDKRKCYDDFGDIDEENDSGFNWVEYWRQMFKTIEIKDIQNYEKEYIGSGVELRDIQKAYVGTRGNMDLMLELIPFSNCDSEPRIQDIVRNMINDGEVEEYPGFFNESKIKKKRRRSKWEEEKKIVELVDIKTLTQEIEENNAKRLKRFSALLDNMETDSGKEKNRKSLTNGANNARRGQQRKCKK